ncbi:N-ethylmaleimide-sensitive factor attachment protein, beta, isoform CRA_g [Homo sapiens]|nr:N-ethylmaleimide-sensitive factor attachment protein, beta, isoform CRA_g [Homo sapiens]
MDNAGKEREAVQLMAEAEKRVKASHSFLRGLFGGNTRIEEACEMYTRAANMFKMAKNWSGKVYNCSQAPHYYCRDL